MPGPPSPFSAKKITEKVYRALDEIDKRPIRGEYKVWIYKSYLVPSLTFNLTVERIPKSVISKLQTRATSLIKRWLNVPRCATLASLFHPEVTNLPYLPHTHEKAKLRLLAQVYVSQDTRIQDLQSLILNPAFGAREAIPPRSTDTMLTNGRPPNAQSAQSVLNTFNTALASRHCDEWNSHLESLSVQKKLLDVVQLEQQTHVWSRIMFSLPAGQMSFLIRAGIDCLPSPVNLCRWKIQCDPSCPLCRTRPCTVRHILSCCPTALNQERYTWRHDSILAHLTQLLKLHLPYGTTLYADLPGLRASENPTATIPTSVATTTARPDIVVIQNNRITLLELTVPTNTQEGLQEARTRKQLKPNYLALLNDLETLGFQSALETIEVGTLGHFSNQTIASLQAPLPNLRKNSVRRLLLGLSKTSVSCSAHIFKAQHHVDFTPIRSPFSLY